MTAPSIPVTWFVAGAGTFLSLIVFRGLQAFRKARSFANGAIVGLVIVGLFYVDFQQSKSSAATAFQ